MVALNKADRERRARIPVALESDAVSISARTGAGLEDLKERVLERLPRQEADGELGLLRQRHVDSLRRVEAAALNAGKRMEGQQWELAAADLHEALRSVAELLGEDATDAVLDRIFSSFCIGK